MPVFELGRHDSVFMTKQNNIPVLTLDGPSGTGKGSVGKIVAHRLGWHYLDSGAVYRVFALLADEAGFSEQDYGSLEKLGNDLVIDFGIEAGRDTVICNGRELSAQIRQESCGELASRYAAVARVRALLLDLQRAQKRGAGLVADGRDMGTTVFPRAEVKIYLVASADVRAERRYKQLREKGFSVNLARLRENMMERDARDASRASSPMMMADDAVLLDTSDLAIEEVIEKVLSLVENRQVEGQATR